MPQSQLTGAAVFEDITTANAALADIYSRMREGGVVAGVQNGGTILMAGYSDDLEFYGENVDIEQFNKHTMMPSNTMLSGLWNTTYGQIYAINAFIEGIESSSVITGADRDRLLGEAIFLRAYFNFYLVNLFGDMPYVTITDYAVNAVISKTSEAEVWNNIKSDLLLAQTLVPEDYPTTDRVRPNKATVTALLARIYLYTAEYELAEQQATLVIDNPLYIWETDPGLIFLKESPSTIWSIHPGAAGLNTKDARAYIFSAGPPFKPALSANLMNSFETGDVRKTLWTRAITDGTDTWHHAYKYKKLINTGTSQEYTILFRLAEQYLIRAEARTMSGDLTGAQQDLNMVRNRAGLPNTMADTQSSLLAAILHERRVEFFAEQSHRWFDLKRTGTASSVLSVVKPGWQETDTHLPIPESELLLNENLLPQNPGY